MTPTKYAALGFKFNDKRKQLFAYFFTGVAVAVLSAIASKMIDPWIPHQIPFGMGGVVMIISWGVLMAVYGYGPKKKLNPEIIKQSTGVAWLFYNAQSWWVAMVLNVWFVSGTALIPWLLWRQIVSGN